MNYSPQNASKPPWQFEIEGQEYLIGMFNAQITEHPKVEHAVLASLGDDGKWVMEDEMDKIWSRMESENSPPPHLYAKVAVANFNITLLGLHPGAEPLDPEDVYEALVATFFRTRLEVKGNQLVIV